jgi:hypothetical protein
MHTTNIAYNAACQLINTGCRSCCLAVAWSLPCCCSCCRSPCTQQACSSSCSWRAAARKAASGSTCATCLSAAAATGTLQARQRVTERTRRQKVRYEPANGSARQASSAIGGLACLSAAAAAGTLQAKAAQKVRHHDVRYKAYGWLGKAGQQPRLLHA